MSPCPQWVQEAMRSKECGDTCGMVPERSGLLCHTAGGQEVSLTSTPPAGLLYRVLLATGAPPWGWQLTVASHQLGICGVLVRLRWRFIAAESSTQNSRGRTERFVCPGWRCSGPTAAWSWLPGFGRCRSCVLPRSSDSAHIMSAPPCHRCLYASPCKNLKIQHQLSFSC